MLIVLLKAFTKLGQGALAVYVKNVITLMTADVQFASLSPQIGDLKASYDAYDLALTNNVNGGRMTTIEKDKCKRELLDKMKSLALLVNHLADGSDTVIMAAGLDVRKATGSYTSLAAPNVLKLTNESEPGVVTVLLSKVEGATVYGVEKRKIMDPETTAWQNGDYSSALKFQLNNLESGKTYQLQFRSIGNKGLVSPWSKVVELLVS